MLEEINEI